MKFASIFQSTLPARGATRDSWGNQRKQDVFQSTLPARGATAARVDLFPPERFQSTLPARGATSQNRHFCQRHRISIHAPRTGSDQSDVAARVNRLISIHAPRTGSDAKGEYTCRCPSHISIHAPRTGSDAMGFTDGYIRKVFQSTLPARGATKRRFDLSAPDHHFNPRSPHGERHNTTFRVAEDVYISIHAPRTGSDAHESLPVRHPADFNPRSPHGERQGE